MQNRNGTFWLVGAVVATIAGTPAAVAAQPPAGGSLAFRGPEGCPSESSVRADVEALIGRSWAQLEERIDVDAQVDALGDRYSLLLRAGDAERRIEGESCAALAQAAVLLVAWMIDPTVPDPTATDRDVAPRTRAAELAAPLPPVEPAPVEMAGVELLADPSHAPAARPGRISVGIGASFVLDVGTLPSVSPGVAGEVVVRIDRLDLRARGGWISTQSAALANPLPGAGAEVEWAGGSVLACGRPLDEGPGLSLCGGVQAGALVARGYGVSSPGRGEAPVAALAFGAALPFSPIPELDLEIALDLLVPLASPVFYLEGVGDVFSPAPVAGRLSLGGHVDVR